jgi:HMG (high mobility group) box
MNILIDDIGIDTSPPSPPDTSHKGKKEKKLQHKKPPNPFILFSLDNRARIAEENKELSNSEISRLLGISWRQLHPDEKRKYKLRAAEVKDDPKYDDVVDEQLTSLFHALRDVNNMLNSIVKQ